MTNPLVQLLLAALFVVGSTYAQGVVLDSSVFDPRVEQQVNAATLYPLTVTRTAVQQQQQVIQQKQPQVLRTAYDYTTINAEPLLSTTTIVNQVPSTTRIVNQVQQPQTVVTQKTVYVEQPQPTVIQTVVNSVLVREQMPAVTVTVTQVVEVRPRVRIFPTTVVRTTLITETLPVEEPTTITETAVITTTIRTAELDLNNGGRWANDNDNIARVTQTVTKTWWETSRGPEVNTYSSVTTTNDSKFVGTKTETTYFPNAAVGSPVALRYVSGSGTSYMQLILLGAILVAGQTVIAKLFA